MPSWFRLGTSTAFEVSALSSYLTMTITAYPTSTKAFIQHLLKPHTYLTLPSTQLTLIHSSAHREL